MIVMENFLILQTEPGGLSCRTKPHRATIIVEDKGQIDTSLNHSAIHAVLYLTSLNDVRLQSSYTKSKNCRNHRQHTNKTSGRGLLIPEHSMSGTGANSRTPPPTENGEHWFILWTLSNAPTTLSRSVLFHLTTQDKPQMYIVPSQLPGFLNERGDGCIKWRVEFRWDSGYFSWD